MGDALVPSPPKMERKKEVEPIKESLLKHIKEISTPNPSSNSTKVECGICGYSFPSSEKLSTHQLRAHRGNQWKCKACNQEMTNLQKKSHPCNNEKSEESDPLSLYDEKPDSKEDIKETTKMSPG